jgi:predicted metal-dependent hydrolase
MIATIFEAALRALAVAVLVGAGIWALRVKNVVAQKVAWVMALCAALLMPAVMRWQILPGVQMPATFAAPWKHTAVREAEPVAKPVVDLKPVAERVPVTERVVVVRHKSASSAASLTVTGSVCAAGVNEPAVTLHETAASVSEAKIPVWKRFNVIAALEWIYFAVLAALLLRLMVGVAAAWRLWMGARPVSAELLPLLPDGSAARSVRASERVASPVTIGGGILLPADFGDWPEEKLRVVLAHEESHVRQRDFYLQLAARAHAAVFWFSPLGWWLKRKLTELSETISDGAALRAATDAESYAQVLLEFAAGARPVFAGVAMARKSNLPSRIERLLNDTQFKTAFAEGRVRMYLAGVLVPLALLAATVHVQGAVQQQESATSATQQSGSTQQQPQTTVTVQAQSSAPEAQEEKQKAEQRQIQIIMKDDGGKGVKEKRSFSYMVGEKGESWALIEKGNENDNFVGNFGGESAEQLAKARKMAKGDFFWFTRDGKSYVVDDPTTLKEIAEAMEVQEEMFVGPEVKERAERIVVKNDKNGDMVLTTPGEKGEKGEKTIILRKRDLDVKVKVDIDKEMKAVQEELKKVEVKLNKEESAEIEKRMAELQQKLDKLQNKIDVDVQADVEAATAHLDKLNEELNVQTEVKVMDENRVKASIEESLKNGKARLVE